MKRILITGGNGYLAKKISASLKGQFRVRLLTRKDVDLTKGYSVSKWFENNVGFDAVIHTAVTGGRRTGVQNSGKPTPSDSEVVDQNLRMYYNLLECRSSFKKLIQLGSGAEKISSQDPYVISKKIISNSVSEKDNFYNIRIYSVFDEDEQDDRFIKGSLLKYINKEEMAVHCSKKMDFFYMEDFISIVKYYLEAESPPKEIDCTYPETRTLNEIADYINTLGEYNVHIHKSLKNKDDYCGNFVDLGLNYVGLDEGISRVYKALLNS